MTVQVRLADGGDRIGGDWEGAEKANAFLGHLGARAFSPATVRAYAFDVVNLARFLTGEGMRLAAVTPGTCSPGWTGKAPAATVRTGPARSWRCGVGPRRRLR